MMSEIVLIFSFRKVHQIFRFEYEFDDIRHVSSNLLQFDTRGGSAISSKILKGLDTLVVLVCDIDIDSVSVSVEQIHNTIAFKLK
jgi:hypothetical protein